MLMNFIDLFQPVMFIIFEKNFFNQFVNPFVVAFF